MSFSGSGKTGISEFLKLAETIPVIDVRSPSEFNKGHIPGAFNIPLFDDSEREAVGIVYNREGRYRAILKGLELVGPTMVEKLQKARQIAVNGRLLIHCWRGGMRSGTMAWLFSLGDITTYLLEGGYKSYRQEVLSSLSEKRKVIVLGGMTGSGKTHILRRIKELGNQVIDMEAIACHKGSAFGSLGRPPQPTSEQFANMLYDQWRKTQRTAPVWLEDESRNIGNVFIPDIFFNNMQEAPTIILIRDREKRIPALAQEYAGFPAEMLRESVRKISKRLGDEKSTDSLKAIETGNLEKAIDIVLRYYDKAYMHGIAQKPASQLIYVESDSDSTDEITMRVLEATAKIIW